MPAGIIPGHGIPGHGGVNPDNADVAMSARCLLIISVCWAVGVSMASAQVEDAYFDAGTAREVDQGIRLELLDIGRISLAPVTTLELVSSPEQRRGASRGSALAVAGGLQYQAALTLPELPRFVTREISMLWRVSVPPGRARNLSGVPVRVSWETVTTERSLSRSAEPIRATPRIQARSEDRRGFEVIEGGVALEIPVSLLQAGRIHGRLIIDVQEF